MRWCLGASQIHLRFLNTTEKIAIAGHLFPLHHIPTRSLPERGLWIDRSDWTTAGPTIADLKLQACLCNLLILALSSYPTQCHATEVETPLVVLTCLPQRTVVLPQVARVLVTVPEVAAFLPSHQLVVVTPWASRLLVPLTLLLDGSLPTTIHEEGQPVLVAIILLVDTGAKQVLLTLSPFRKGNLLVL